MTKNNNLRTGWIVKVTLALFVLLATSQSYAACSQSDLAGTWFLNGVTGDTLFAEFWETDFCKIKINSSGKVVRSASQCTYRDGDGKSNLDVRGGELLVNSFCAVTGKINYCDGDLCVKFQIDAGRLDKGKTVITVVGRISSLPDIVSFYTGIKK